MFVYEDAVRLLLHCGVLFLLITMCFCLIGAVRGPKLADRVVAINMIGVKATLLLVIFGVSVGFDEAFLVDVALVYALLSFLAVVVLTRFMLQVKLLKAKQKAKLLQKPDNSDKENS